MWVTIAPILIRLGISLAIALLQRTGVINGLEADGIKAGTHVIAAVENTKTYSAPEDFPAQVHKDGV